MFPEALNTVSWGMFEVNTAHERTYIISANLIVLIAGKPGEKNMPILESFKKTSYVLYSYNQFLFYGGEAQFLLDIAFSSFK